MLLGYLSFTRHGALPPLLITALCLVHMQLELGVCFSGRPDCADATTATYAAPFSNQLPITEQTWHDFHAIEAVLGDVVVLSNTLKNGGLPI